MASQWGNANLWGSYGSPVNQSSLNMSPWIPGVTATAPVQTQPQTPAPTGDVLGRNVEAVPQQPSGPSANEMLQGNWDSYVADLDAQLGTLGGMKTAQEGVVTGRAEQAQADLDLQQTQGLQGLESQRTKTTQNQAKNLRDLAGNVTSAMRAGNIYLGAKGAGDSSAANQYAYALTKLGTREQSNVMQNTAQIMDEIAGRETNLNNIYNTETTKLDKEKQINLDQVTQWYNDAVMTIQSQKTQNRAQLSQQILDQAMQALNSIQQQAMDRRTALDQWAISNSESMAGLKANMQEAAQFSPQLPQTGPIAGTPQVSGGNLFTPGYGGGYGDEEENRLF